MPAKSERTQKSIIDAATKLFSEKGFSAVTMSDVCKATGLSRGGVYRYFSSIEDLFAHVLEEEQNMALRVLDEALAAGHTGDVIFEGFLDHQKNNMFHPELSPAAAAQEFARSGPQGMALFEKRARSAVNILTAMIENAQQCGRFKEGDPRLLAQHTLFLLEGMRAHASLIGFESEAEADAHIAHIMEMMRK